MKSELIFVGMSKQAEKGVEATEKLAAAGMEEDGLSQVSELTGLELSGLSTNSACCSDDDGSAAAMSASMSASYASSLASEAAKSRPPTPEAVWPGENVLLRC